MAASGATPIQLYYSTTGAAVPTAGNLLPGELGLNIADMKLYCENSSGTVEMLAAPGVPRSGSAKTTAYTLATTDVGQLIEIDTGGSVEIPDATFALGDAIAVFNNTSGDITITCTITTAYIAGADADVASVTLATRGLATILFISGTVCVISGNVS
jgi:spore coat protein U-like protein